MGSVEGDAEAGVAEYGEAGGFTWLPARFDAPGPRGACGEQPDSTRRVRSVVTQGESCLIIAPFCLPLGFLG